MVSSGVLRFAPVVVALLCLAPSRASASPLVDEGMQRLHDADFAGALQAFDEAERGGDLTRAELITLLGARATVHLALDDQRSAVVDLRMLATLDPHHPIDATAPPDFRRAFERAAAAVHAPLSVTVTHERVDDRVEIEAQAREDTAGVVRSLRVLARRAGGAWLPPETAPASISVPASTALEYYVEAVGPGGAVVATAGSRLFPRTVAPASGDGGGTVPWLWIGLGIGGAVLVATVTAFVFAASANPDTVIEGPFATD